MTEQGGNVQVEVLDDGVGFEVKAVDGGSGLAAMKLFTNLGRASSTVRSSPGQGTLVRSLLGVRADEPSAAPHAPERGLGRLRLIVGSADPPD